MSLPLQRRSLLAAAVLSGCADLPSPPAPREAVHSVSPGLGAAAMPPPAPREFRAAWVATVANIDWPSKPGLSSSETTEEMLRMLDRARAIGLNAIVLQVRPATDAIYPSRLEPWSEYLTGAQGEAPQPWVDPLALWVREAHRRGLELHAWFNPYRAWHPSAKSQPAASHVSRRVPQLVRQYGNLQWLDPGEPDAAAHTLAVVADVLRRYEIDGVHIDDYFYPYPIPLPAPTGGTSPGDQPFPDDASYQRYRDGGGTLERNDWRRDNVNRLIEAMHNTIRRERPGARFGISPFGIGRPGQRPEGIEGFSQYDRLFADVELWVKKGWFDYLVPQLYWPIDRRAQAFPVLLDYWSRQVAASEVGVRHHWPGLYTSSVGRAEGSARSWKAEEIVNQVGVMRDQARGAAPATAGSASGHIHFSMIALMQDRDGLAGKLRQGPYRDDAIAPASPWLDAERPQPPRVELSWGRLRVGLVSGAPPLVWAVWRRIPGEGGAWRFATLPATERTVPTLGADAIVISAVSRTGQESERLAFTLS